jgi:hypothetical protein
MGNQMTMLERAAITHINRESDTQRDRRKRYSII